MGDRDDERRDREAALEATSTGDRAPRSMPALSMPAWLGQDVTPEAVAAFFAAAAALWRAAPWRVVPDEGTLLSVSSEALALDDVISVSGQAETERALRIFFDLEAFETFERLVATTPERAITSPPVYLAIAFAAADALAPSLREEVLRHGWEVAAEDAWPLLWCATPGLGFEMPTTTELENAEGVARAMAAALAEPGPLQAALTGGAPFSREFEVVCGGYATAVTIGAPVIPPPERSLSVAELVARSNETFAANEARDESDEMEAGQLEGELLRRFALVAEPPPTRDTLAYCRFTLEVARDRFDRGVTELTPEEFGKIVLEDVPRELDVPPLAAHRVVDVNRAFLEFLEREADLTQAGICAAWLDDDLVLRLGEALADPSLYDPAKAARMAVLESGLDPDSDEAGIVWMRTFERALAERDLLDPDDSIAFPDVSPPPSRRTPAEQKARKNKRKIARKARRKNR